jgi:hypothetical protein
VKRKIENLCWKEVSWQRPYELSALEELLAHLSAAAPRGPVIWEARGNNRRVRYLLGADKAYMSKLQEVFRTHGDIRFSNAKSRASADTAKSLKISKNALPLKTDAASAVIRAGLVVLSAAPPTEEIIVQIVLGPSYAPFPVASRLADPHATWLQAVLGNVAPASPESRNAVREKSSYRGFCACIRVGASGGSAARHVGGVISALKVMESAGVRIGAVCERMDWLDEAHIPWHFPLRLSVRELACLFLLPAGEEALPGVPGAHPKHIPPPEWYKNPSPARDRGFAVSTRADGKTRLSVSPRDCLEHTVVLGPTGAGKSTVLLNLISADVNAGRSVLVIDPKADIVADCLARIPKWREDDVVVIDPSDPSPVGFNPLGFKNYRDPTLIADAVLAVFKEVFHENWGIRSQDVLSAALLTLAKTENASLLWLPALLTDERFRRKVTGGISDKIGLEAFWNAFEAMKDSERRQEISPVLNKIRQFLLRPGLRNVLGQARPKFSLGDLFNERRIVLVPLNRGLIGTESSRLLGSLIVSLTWTLALSRAALPAERRYLVNVYIDELQDYISLPTDLSDALAQARGLGVGLTLSHQYRAQLPPLIRAGVDSNARNKIVFALNSGDAAEMAAMAPELGALDFMSLPRYHVYASLQADGRSTGWMSGQTLPPPSAFRRAAEIKAKSMSAYGMPAEETEKEYLEMFECANGPEHDASTQTDQDSAIGRRKRA